MLQYIYAIGRSSTVRIPGMVYIEVHVRFWRNFGLGQSKSAFACLPSGYHTYVRVGLFELFGISSS